MKEIWERARQLQGEEKNTYLLEILKTYSDSKGVVQRVLHESDPNSMAADAATDALAEFQHSDPKNLREHGGVEFH